MDEQTQPSSEPAVSKVVGADAAAGPARRDLEEEFNLQRARMKELFLQKEEDLRCLMLEKQQLDSEVLGLRAEVQQLQTLSENQKSEIQSLQLLVNGTKWCGTGDIAADYHDLGADRPLDRCCRTHDLCPSKVRAFSRRYNLTNNSLYSKSHCTCDDMLFDCLKTTNTSAAHLMGHIYFNIVQVPCLEDYTTGRRFREAKQGF